MKDLTELIGSMVLLFLGCLILALVIVSPIVDWHHKGEITKLKERIESLENKQ